MTDVNYGPLAGLIGRWKGDKGEDKSPEPEGTEVNLYTETIEFSAAGDVDNAEIQELAAIHYQLEVHRIRDGKSIHHQTGYWIWDAAAAVVMHSFTIPRAVCVLAGGVYDAQLTAKGSVIIEVSAALDSPDWQIIQSPFMQQNALTKGFQQQMVIAADELSYEQTMLIDIYDKQSFQHTDQNQLQRC